PAPGTPCLSMEWRYDNGNRLSWSMQEDGTRGEIVACFAGREERIPTHNRLLPLENALAEALFF
ncbi:MAG: hypothetical protein ACPGGJ_02165, partial [Coraliomargarita sp.]